MHWPPAPLRTVQIGSQVTETPVSLPDMTSPPPLAGPVRVSVHDLDLDTIADHARTRTTTMTTAATAYGRTSIEMNTVGLLGEHAALTYLTRHGHQATLVGDDISGIRYGGGDIEITRQVSHSPAMAVENSYGVEVKTSRFSAWQRLGRTLDARQLQRSSAAAYLWCVVADTIPTTSVILMGWLPTEEIRTAPDDEPVTIDGRACVRVHRPLRPPPTWRPGSPPSRSRRSSGGTGHPDSKRLTRHVASEPSERKLHRRGRARDLSHSATLHRIDRTWVGCAHTRCGLANSCPTGRALRLVL